MLAMSVERHFSMRSKRDSMILSMAVGGGELQLSFTGLLLSS